MSKQQGIIIGQKGVQYGLQKVVPKKPGLTGAKSAQSKTAPAGPANVFGDDDSDEEDVERQIARQADKKRAAAKVQQMYEDALAEDPSVFDYDGVYDSMQEARTAPKQQDKVQRQSKYIASLLDQAQQRKREQDVLYEKRMVKERQQEDHLFEDKERFVTSAYRRKLEEDKKWQEAERQKELEEQRQDVRKVGHLGNFYANLLTKNVAYGTAKQDAEKERRKLDTEAVGGAGAVSEGGGDREATPDVGTAPSSRPSREASPLDQGEGRAASGQESAAPGPSAKVLAQLDRYDLLRLEAERALLQKRRQEQQEQGPGGDEERPEKAPNDVAEARVASPQPQTQASDRAVVAGAATLPSGGAEAAGAGVAGGKRRNDESAVLSARERYLARKQQKTG